MHISLKVSDNLRLKSFYNHLLLNCLKLASIVSFEISIVALYIHAAYCPLYPHPLSCRRWNFQLSTPLLSSIKCNE